MSIQIACQQACKEKGSWKPLSRIFLAATYAVSASLTLYSVLGPTAAVAAKPKPVIASISAVSDSATQTITITGNNFGTQDPYEGDSDYIALNICPTTKFKNSCVGGWQAGYAPDGNYVGLILQSWTDTQIVIAGFTNYGGQYTLTDGGTVRFTIWNVPTLKRGKPCTVVVGGGQTSC